MKNTFYAKDGGPLGIWRQWAPGAQGEAMKGGHFSRKRIRMTRRLSSNSSSLLKAAT